jgi:hypothetical protein
LGISSQFLKRVYGSQSEAGVGFLSYFDTNDEWQDDAIAPPHIWQLPLPHDALDVYFSVNTFSEFKRRKQFTLPGRWLYADLDEVDPGSLTDLRPTVAWTTSRGRYQCLWLLSRPLGPSKLARLNQLTTYYTEADKGGWGLTKVLRVPGSISTKHGYNFAVKLLWDDGPTYSPAEILSVVKVAKSKASSPSLDEKQALPKLPKVTPSSILRKRKPNAKARKLYKAKVARGDRSARLWELECLLLRAGCTPEETLIVVRKTVWNKYAGQDREVSQLWTEINKAAATVPSTKQSKSRASTLSASKARASTRSTSKTSKRSSRKQSKDARDSNARSTNSKKSSKKSSKSTSRKKHALSGTTVKELYQGVTYNDFIQQRLKKPEWLVESIWSENAHGVLAGEPKTYKSVISTDLAVSIASGTPFLGQFKIPTTGPVLIIQEENDPGEFQDRLNRIAFSRGLLGSGSMDGDYITLNPDVELPIYIYNNQSFDLTDPRSFAFLRKKCRELKPALIILDPFYLMTPGIDENSAAQVGPILAKLLKLKQKYDVGIQLIHHYRKQNLASPIYGAARMSGTGVFHRWFDSAVYVERDPKQENVVRLVPDHRGHAPQGAVRCTFDLGTDSDWYYHVDVSNARSDKAEQHTRLKNLLEEDREWTINQLRLKMGLNSSKPLREMLPHHGYIVRKRKSGKSGRPAEYVVFGQA